MNSSENPVSRVTSNFGNSKPSQSINGKGPLNSVQQKPPVQIKCLPCKGLKAPNISAIKPKINWVMKPNQFVVLNADPAKSSRPNGSVIFSPLARSAEAANTDSETPQVKSINLIRYKMESKPQMRVINHEIKRHGYASSIDEESDGFISPTMRWNSQPKSYKGARKGHSMIRNTFRMGTHNLDTTDGETSGMGSSVDEPFESSTESASEASIPFFPPRTSPQTVKKRRGGWPKGRKRKPETLSSKYPKGPVTAYILYLNERRKYYKEHFPTLPTVEVTKMLGAEWSALPPEQKEEYVERSEQDRRRYRNEMQAFRQSSDYQVYQQIARKKRAKNSLRKGQNSNEESSDFTDEIDDEDEYDLYCKTCDQHFSSIHNKREHMYGRHHLQAITGKIERGKQIMSKRRKRDVPSALVTFPRFKTLCEKTSSIHGSCSSSSTMVADSDDDYLVSTEGESTTKDESMSWRESAGVISTTEDDHDYEDDDEETNDFDDKDSLSTWSQSSSSQPVNDEPNIFAPSQYKDNELGVLTLDEKEMRIHRANLSQELRELEKRQKQLQEEQRQIKEKEMEIKQKFQYLSNTKLFGAISSLSLPSINPQGTPSAPNQVSVSEPKACGLQEVPKDNKYFSGFTNNLIYTIVEPSEEDGESALDPTQTRPESSQHFPYTNHDPNMGSTVDATHKESELQDLFIEDNLNMFSERVLEDAEAAYHFGDPFSIT